jgi:tetratricopeptide (TPR) repeat protein
MRPLLLLTFVVPLLLQAQTALADDTAIAQAKQRFAAGRQAYGEGRYKDAVELFLQANALDAHAELLYNVGQAYEKLDDVPNALRVFREYLRLLPNSSDRAVIQAKTKKLEARLQERGVQQVTVSSRPVGATVILDDKPVGATPWTGEIAPGHHVVTLRSAGYADGVADFVLAPDHATDVDLGLARPGPELAAGAPLAGGPAGPPPPTPPDAPKPARRVAPWTFAALGLGVASLGAALGFELAREGAEKSAKNDPTQIGYHNDYGQMTSFQTASRAFVGVGAVATAAGGVLLVLDLRSGSEAKPQRTGLGCFSGTCGAFAGGSF